MVQIGNIEGNSDASIGGTIVPYPSETYPQREARIAKELAGRASQDVMPDKISDEVESIADRPL